MEMINLLLKKEHTNKTHSCSTAVCHCDLGILCPHYKQEPARLYISNSVVV